MLEYPLYCDNVARGTLIYQQDGLMRIFEARAPGIIDGGVWRAYVCMEGSAVRLPVGVMQPLNGGLRAAKSFTRLELAQAGFETAALTCGVMTAQVGWEEPGAIHEWAPAINAEKLVEDPALYSSIQNGEGLLMRQAGEYLYLAAPLEDEGPLLLAPAFCLLSVEEIDGRRHGVLKLERLQF